MRSVVLEIKNGKAAVLDDTGIVRAIKDRGYETGQVLSLSEVELKREEIPAKRRSAGTILYSRIAAAILAVAVVGGGVSAYAAPVSTVTVDGEESVKYRLNIFDRVVGMEAAEGSDDEFRKDISELSGEIRGMKITDAMELTADRMEEGMNDAERADIPEITVTVGGLKHDSRRLHEKVDNKAVEINRRRPEAKPVPDTEREGTGKPDERVNTDRNTEENTAQSPGTDITDRTDTGENGPDMNMREPVQNPSDRKGPNPAGLDEQRSDPPQEAPDTRTGPGQEQMPEDNALDMPGGHREDMLPEEAGGQMDREPVQMPDMPRDIPDGGEKGGPRPRQ